MRAWELNETIERVLYHTTSEAYAREIMDTGMIRPKSGEAFISFSKKPFTGDISHNEVTLKIDGAAIANDVMDVEYTEQWYERYPDHAAYIAGEGWGEQFIYPDDCYDEEGFEDTECAELAYREAELNSFLVKDNEEEVVSKAMGEPIQIKNATILEAEKADLPDIEIGDELKIGKFKNRKVIVKGFKKDKHNHPIAKTTKGDVQLLKPRVTKLEPKKIDETFDQPYSYEWSAQTNGAWRGRFRSTSNDYVDVDIENFKQKWSIEFSRNDDHNVTGGGDAMRIFATVISMIDEFISIQSPLVVKFSADKSKSGSDSRSKLYTRMINRFADNIGYSVTMITEDNKIFYTLTMKEDLNEGSHQDDAEAYAEQHGMEVTWEGSGDMGEAYITDKDTIIKVTTDKTEMAMALKLVGQKLLNVVDIYDVQEHIIHMEYLNTSGVEEVYYDVMQYDNGDGIEYIDPDDHPDMSEEAIKMIQDLTYGIYELGKNGIQNLDIKGDNIGQKSNGDYAIFDMSDVKRGMW